MVGLALSSKEGGKKKNGASLGPSIIFSSCTLWRGVPKSPQNIEPNKGFYCAPPPVKITMRYLHFTYRKGWKTRLRLRYHYSIAYSGAQVPALKTSEPRGKAQREHCSID